MTEEEIAAKAAADKAKADADKAKADADKLANDKKYGQEYVDKLRKEAADARVEAKALKDAQDALESEKLKKNGEYEKIARDAEAKALKAEKRIVDLEAATKGRLFRTELRSAAVAAGIDDIDDVALIAVGDISVIDDDDLEAHAAKLVKDFKTLKPKKFVAKDDTNLDRLSNTRATPKPRATPTTNAGTTVTAKNAKDMTKAEFDDAWARA